MIVVNLSYNEVIGYLQRLTTVAIGDLYQVILTQTYGANGKPLQNSFTFVQTVGTGGAQELAEGFEDTWLTEINPIQGDHIKNISIKALNCFSVTDFFELVPAVEEGGAVGVDVLQRQSALNFTFKSARRDVRSGSKRIAGLPEAAVTNGIVTDATYIGAINDLRLLFGTDLASGGSTFEHVIAKRVYVEPDPPTHKGYYRLPENVGELTYASILAVLVNLDLTTQASRT